MPVSSEDILKALGHVSDADQLKVTIQGSLYGSLFVAVACMVCSMILGPPGLLIGGILGSYFAYNKLKGTYKPLSSVLKELTPEQKKELAKDLEGIRANITATDYVELIVLLQGGGGILLKKQILETVFSFVKNKLKLGIA